MKESIGRIQQEGSSEPLLELVKRQRIKRMSTECMKTYKDGAYFTVLNHNALYCYYEGIVEKSASVLLELYVNRVIEVDIQAKQLLRVNGEDVSGIEHAQVLNLNDDGERWEGDVLNNKPFGWGVYYDSENRMVYEGFRIGEVNMCYGRSYYPDIQKVEYEGDIFMGKRWGRGVQFDRSGKTVFDGEWMNYEHLNKRVELSEDNQLLHNRIEELIVSDKSCNGREWKGVDFSILVMLRELRVGDKCFMNVKEVKLVGLNQLETVVIGKQCFTRFMQKEPIRDSDRHFCLKNCERLRELKIGCDSFSDYSVCEIESGDSLEVIEMGELDTWSYVFWCSSLELRSDSERMK